MICEGIILLKDKDYGDSTLNRKAGDFIAMRTEVHIRDKWAELLSKGILNQETVDQYSDINKPVSKIVPEDLLFADLRWPWGTEERKMYLVVKMDLTDDEIRDLSQVHGELIGNDFVQYAFRKKNIKLDSLKQVMDDSQLDDPAIDYQPIEEENLDKSYIEDARTGVITSEIKEK